MDNQHHHKSSLLVISSGVVVLMLIVMTSILTGCASKEMHPTPTATAIIQYWLTPTQYSTLELPTPTETPKQEFSTPELIDLAYTNGKITSEQRLLYLAYALYEYESLPAQFHGTKGWRGTSTAWELHEVISDPSVFCSMSPNIRNEFQRLFTKEMSCETSDQVLSTPELIDQALAKGEITKEERLLYLTYAFFEYQSLPLQFQSNVGWRGTNILGELEEAINDPAAFCSMSSNIQSEIQRLINPHTTCETFGGKVSTPTLIGQALENGQISEELRLLYLVYAVYEPDSLPIQFRGNSEWEGTLIVREIKEAAASPTTMCNFSSFVQNELRRLLHGGATCK